MKFRTCLLAICMVVVPAVAMFSHHVPATARRSVRTCLRGWLARLTPGSTEPACSAEPGPASQSGAIAATAQPGSAVATSREGPAAPGTPKPPSSVAASDPFGVDRRTGTPGENPATAALPRSMPASLATGPGRQLEALGAVDIECVSLPGAAGRCLASCRVPLDAAGQLQRVFQAEGATPDEATGLLVDELVSWQRRMAERQAAGVPTATGEQRRL